MTAYNLFLEKMFLLRYTSIPLWVTFDEFPLKVKKKFVFSPTKSIIFVSEEGNEYVP